VDRLRVLNPQLPELPEPDWTGLERLESDLADLLLGEQVDRAKAFEA
jgi:hypothetical protein